MTEPTNDRNKHTETIKRRYNRISTAFNIMEKMGKDHWKAGLLDDVRGKVLEVGAGTGANFPLYPEHAEVTAIDFSPGMLRFARERAKEVAADITVLEMDAQHLDFPDDTFDFVVSTCVFCSVPDPVQGLKEMRRVCKPEGKVLMLEHMRSENPVMGAVMDALNPVVVRMIGVNINRRTMDNIRAAGFTVEDEVLVMGTIMRRLTLHPNKSST